MSRDTAEMADDPSAAWVRDLVAEKSGAEVWDVMRTLRVDDVLVEVQRSKGGLFSLVAYSRDGECHYLTSGRSSDRLESAISLSDWSLVLSLGQP